ncbi:excinuclease ABC subunit UvrA [Streptomyces sp. DSM 41029]
MGERVPADGITEWITVTGARTHNLRGIDVRIPKGRIVAFTGVSGSGKSSLAIDTLHAEAQLRYLEGISPFVRQYLAPKDRPQVERVAGLSPTLAVDQRKLNHNSRSTIATMTGLDAYLSLLFSRIPYFSTDRPADAPPISGRSFDKHTPEGSCPVCLGAGGVPHPDVDLIVPHPDLPLMRGASPWFGKLISPEQAAVPSLAQHFGVDLSVPWRELPERFRDALLYGTGDEAIRVSVKVSGKNSTASWTWDNQQPLRGAVAEVERLFRAAKTETAKQRYLKFMRQVPCSECEGTGYGPVARTTLLAGQSFVDTTGLPVADLRLWTDRVGEGLGRTQQEIAETLLPEIAARLDLLSLLGLGHVQLSRTAPSLSGGELQRARLAAQLSTALTGVIFILDEPSSGLHPADKEPLFAMFERLRDAGNTVFLVEHDPELVARADWVVDLGPGAGQQGGQLIASLPPRELARHPGSATGRFLDPAARRVIRSPRPVGNGTRWLTLEKIAVHNVAVDRAGIPVNRLTCITGVSGSGKSSLLHGGLAAGVQAALAGETCENVGGIDGLDAVSWSVVVDQEPIGRTPRSNPATYTKAFDGIRRLFAGTDAAAARGLNATSFSFNAEGGRCETCQGHGRRQADMHFLPSLWVTCEACDGRRFGADVLAVSYRGHTVDRVLDLTVDAAAGLFEDASGVAPALRAMQQVGLGYLRLGQSATELSGGEAQRLKLATALMRGSKRLSRGLVILDEPVTGLHPANMQVLVDAFELLLDGGSTVVVAEHDLHFAACADWILDMGPGGGAAGGRLVHQGDPRGALDWDSPTARHLARMARDGHP